MFTIKVEWHSPDFPTYSVHNAEKYTVSYLADGSIQLLTETGLDGQRDIRLSDGAKAYVMNDRGATIDTIKTWSKPEMATLA